MGLRIQPKDIHISDDPEGDPFANDLLARQMPVSTLVNILLNVEGPCVVAVDSPWGMGKTTFLRLLEQRLRNRSVPVLRFDAWATDFAEDPFVALSTEITRVLYDITTGTLRAKALTLAKLTGHLVGKGSLLALRMGAAAFGGPGQQLAQAITPRREWPDPTPPAMYLAKKKLVTDFRSTLEDISSAPSKANGGLPLVVLVDELDRCRPTYALELLEAAKHFLSVKNIVFVLCLDRTQLQRSIKAVYGSEFDTAGYLLRFFDIHYTLPEPDRNKFVQQSLDGLGISDCLNGKQAPKGKEALKLLSAWLMGNRSSLRNALQTMHRLTVVFASIDRSTEYNAMTLVVLAILRSVKLDVYNRLIAGTVTDKEVVEAFFRDDTLSELRRTRQGDEMEGILIAASAWFTRTPRSGGEDKNRLPVLTDLRQKVVAGGSPTSASFANVVRENRVLQTYRECCGPATGGSTIPREVLRDYAGFKFAIRCLELLRAISVGEPSNQEKRF